MALSLTSKFMKYALIIFNLLFVITGIILISVGAVTQGLYYSYHLILDDGFLTTPALLIAIGVIIFLVSCFGCWGAFKENYCFTITFCGFLLLIFVLELSGGIAGYLLRDRVETVLEARMNLTMGDYDKTDNKLLWDEMQTKFECCGVHNGSSEWIAAIHRIPDSCYPGQNNATGTLYPRGCFEKVEEIFESHAVGLGGVGIGISIIQLMGLIFACNLASSIRKDYESV